MVTLSQLVAFLSYQVRLVAGLKAMQAQASRPARAAATPPAPHPANTAATAPGDAIRLHGFTNESLEWKAWLDVVDLEQATPEQIAILEESHPKAKVSDYYRFLVHQPRSCASAPPPSTPSCMPPAACRAPSASWAPPWCRG